MIEGGILLCSNLKEARSKAIDAFVISQKSGTDSKTRRETKRMMQSLAQTWFVHGNFMAGKVDKGSFDCITAFSVTKWIHLHGGDGAIRYFFGKVRDLLSEGGRFIVEPQSWKSYKSASAKMKRQLDRNLHASSYFFRIHELELRPEDFCKVLPQEFGLTFVRQLEPPIDSCAGFDRQIYMFQKLGTT